tara:strand:- start:329 stop:2227 length:1899 start_codon:yes stop_codon:yes gene_type:complete
MTALNAQYSNTIETAHFPQFNVWGTSDYIGSLAIGNNATTVLENHTFGVSGNVTVRIYSHISDANYTPPHNFFGPNSGWLIVTDEIGNVLKSEEIKLNNMTYQGGIITNVDHFHISAIQPHPTEPNKVIFTGRTLDPLYYEDDLMAGTIDVFTLSSTGSFTLSSPISSLNFYKQGYELTIYFDINAGSYKAAIIGTARSHILVSIYDFDLNIFDKMQRHDVRVWANDFLYGMDIIYDEVNNNGNFIIAAYESYNVLGNMNFCGFTSLPTNTRLALYEYDPVTMSIVDAKSYVTRNISDVSFSYDALSQGIHIISSPLTNTFFATSEVMEYPTGGGAPTRATAIYEFDINLNIISSSIIKAGIANQVFSQPRIHGINNKTEFALTLNHTDGAGVFSSERGIGMYKFDPATPLVPNTYYRLNDWSNGVNPGYADYSSNSTAALGEMIYYSVGTQFTDMPNASDQFVHIFGYNTNFTSNPTCEVNVAIEFESFCTYLVPSNRTDDQGISVLYYNELTLNNDNVTGLVYDCVQGHFSNFRMKRKIEENQDEEINENSIEYLTYPNPVNNILNIEVVNKDDEDILNIRILNIHGSIVKDGVIDKNKVEIDLSGLNSGVYFIQIEGKTKVFKTKIIKI